MSKDQDTSTGSVSNTEPLKTTKPAPAKEEPVTAPKPGPAGVNPTGVEVSSIEPTPIEKLKESLKPKNWIKNIKRFIKNIPSIVHAIKTNFKPVMKETISFIKLFSMYLVKLVASFFINRKATPDKVRRKLYQVMAKLESMAVKLDDAESDDMNRFEVFDLALKNMSSKKLRSLITIGGMSIGIGVIVFLVSIGYGLQKLVITKVARLDELKQADITIQPGSNVYLDNEAIDSFEEIKGVAQVLPMIGVASKINFQGSISDVAVYGVDTDYLKNSAVTTIKGKLFDSSKSEFNPYEYEGKNIIVEKTNSKGETVTERLDKTVSESTESVEENLNETNESTESAEGAVQGIKTYPKVGEILGPVKFSFFPQHWVPVYEGPSRATKLLGYTRIVEGIQYGDELWGDSYYPSDKGSVVKNERGAPLGIWIKSSVYLWEKEECDKEENFACEDSQYTPKLDDNGNKTQLLGYFDESSVLVNDKPISETMVLDGDMSNNDTGQVLGVRSDGLQVTAEPVVLGDEATGEDTVAEDIATDDLAWLSSILNLDITNGSEEFEVVEKVEMHPDALREAIVNVAMLKVLGLERNEAIGKEFDVSFVVTSSLLGEGQDKLESMPVQYKIVGVVPEDNIPFFYAPIDDIKSLGVHQFSQVKIVSDTEQALSGVREKIEALGYITNSVTDTVDQINRLFKTSRVLLALVGSVALGVAAFGMFNTMTVSLLERTREVGLMKAMGMTSAEVRRLFLSESLMMGFLGGVAGILVGFLGGKLISLVLTIIGISRGIGAINISHLPLGFTLLVFLLSLIVGIATGVYPSKRATSISALNALRYE